MRPSFCIAILTLCMLAPIAFGEPSFRGLPYYVKVERVTIQPERNNDVQRFAEVCYRFAPTIPLFDYRDLASKMLRNDVIMPQPFMTYDPIEGHFQRSGVAFFFRLMRPNIDVIAFMNSAYTSFRLPQLIYFNSLVRGPVGYAKPFSLTQYQISHRDMTFAQFEWVTTCEAIPFAKAYSAHYIKRLFDQPGPLGHMAGRTQFNFNIHFHPINGWRPRSLQLREASYVVPVFGTSPLSEGDKRMIAVSHFNNSLNLLTENSDTQMVAEVTNRNRNLITQVEEYYHVDVVLPLTADGMVDLLHRIATQENSKKYDR